MNNIKPEHILLKQVYDSESIVDLGRDVSESFSSDFTPNAQYINDDSEIAVHFVFNYEDETIIMKNQCYSLEELNDIEEDLRDSFCNLNRPDMPDFPGFFYGDMTLTIYIK